MAQELTMMWGTFSLTEEEHIGVTTGENEIETIEKKRGRIFFY
jgi:hypothetical protein